jgi:hypothetical protein
MDLKQRNVSVCNVSRELVYGITEENVPQRIDLDPEVASKT